MTDRSPGESTAPKADESVSRRHLRTKRDELRRRYETLTKRIEALDKDIGREIEEFRRQPLQERRSDLAAEREQVQAELEEIERRLGSDAGGIGEGPNVTPEGGSGQAESGGSAAQVAPLDKWDVFISHASEDKEAIARPLAKALEAKGLRVWFDEFALTVGDRLRRSIDHGLAGCRYGIVILSPMFFAKEWPQKELDGLVQREERGEKVILPVWHEVSVEQIAAYSPLLADRIAVRSDLGLERVVAELLRAMRFTPTHPDVLTIIFPIHLELVRVPAGEFLMGSDLVVDKDASTDEVPQHRVNLPEFYIGKYPVTLAQFAVFAEATGDTWNSNVRFAVDHPVTLVSWHEARAFCQWLSTATGRVFELPSEAQWEKAARGTDGRLYPWGNEVPNERLCNFAHKVGEMTPVGAYPAGASPYGVLDMSGNVWEWCRTKWGEDYKGKPDDTPEGTDMHVLRGGAFDYDAGGVRCACRGRYIPHGRSWGVGFRVVASPGIHDSEG